MANPHGQVQLESSFCHELQKLISENNFETIVEIGTWKGMGSTYCILQGIGNSNVNFISLESFKEFHDIAKNNLRNYLHKVKLLHGRIIEVEEFLDFNKNLFDGFRNDQKNWFKNDVDTYKKCENVLESIPNKIDLLVLDGGEFSTYLEWLKLKDRAQYVVLDDTKCLKTKRITEECLKDPKYKLIISSEERNGFHIFEKIDEIS